MRGALEILRGVRARRRGSTGALIRRTALGVAVFGAIAAAAPAALAATPRWVHLTPGANPPAGFDLPMAYDAATSQLVLLDSVNGATWTWDGSTWTAASPSASPSIRRDAVMAYDASTKQLILFGGLNGNNPLNDTWSWTGTTWVKLSPAASPPKALQASLAFDAATGQLVLFGAATKYVAGNAAPSRHLDLDLDWRHVGAAAPRDLAQRPGGRCAGV